MACFLLFDELYDDTVQNWTVVDGNLNSDDGVELKQIMKEAR